MKLIDKIKRKKTLILFISNIFKKCNTLVERFCSRSLKKENSKKEALFQ